MRTATPRRPAKSLGQRHLPRFKPRGAKARIERVAHSQWTVPIIVGLIAVAGSYLTAKLTAEKAANATIQAARVGFQAEILKAQNALEVEDKRLQAALILRAAEAPPAEAAERLSFFLRLGFLKGVNQDELAKIIAEKAIPQIPPPRSAPAAELGACRVPRTAAEVRAFQRANRLPVNGKWDEATTAAITEMQERCGTPYVPSLDFSDPRNSALLGVIG